MKIKSFFRNKYYTGAEKDDIIWAKQLYDDLPKNMYTFKDFCKEYRLYKYNDKLSIKDNFVNSKLVDYLGFITN